MKGLLINSFFAARSNAKVFSVFMALLGLFVVAVISPPLLIGYVLLGMVGFSVNAIAGIKKESASRWVKYKLTLPIKRADIVKSYFVSQLLWLLVGTLFAGVAVSVSWLLHGCPFDSSVTVILIFASGISMSLFTGACFFPLLYCGGEERSEVFLVICSLLAFLLSYPLTVRIYSHKEY